jgi:hypothetical protein
MCVREETAFGGPGGGLCNFSLWKSGLTLRPDFSVCKSQQVQVTDSLNQPRSCWIVRTIGVGVAGSARPVISRLVGRGRAPDLRTVPERWGLRRSNNHTTVGKLVDDLAWYAARLVDETVLASFASSGRVPDRRCSQGSGLAEVVVAAGRLPLNGAASVPGEQAMAGSLRRSTRASCSLAALTPWLLATTLVRDLMYASSPPDRARHAPPVGDPLPDSGGGEPRARGSDRSVLGYLRPTTRLARQGRIPNGPSCP